MSGRGGYYQLRKPMIIKEFAPAKINLTLEVLGKRPDGYHELQSLVSFATVGDHLELDTSKPVGSTVKGPLGATISGKNLIDVALAKLAAVEPDLQLGHVTLDKQLPVAAGIGGGSADAAAVLRAVRQANPHLAEEIDWHAIATSLGADVPVCMLSQRCWMTGLGEIIQPIPASTATMLSGVIVNPLVPVPADKTAQVFRALAAPPLPQDLESPPRPELTNARALMKFVREGRNDLEAPACSIVPVITEVLGELAALPGCCVARMSGGGPTCFALFDNGDAARAATLGLLDSHPKWWHVAVALT